MQLEAIQTYISEPHAKLGNVRLLTAGPPVVAVASCTSACVSGGSSAACAWAMLRVAAQEQKAVQWQSCALDTQAGESQAVLQGTDSFGMISSAGTWLSPQLTACQGPAQSASVPSPAAAAMLRGTVLVTGGLGDIGLLVGLWVAATWPAARVFLLSRTGRASALLPTVSDALTPVTAVRCDVGSFDELCGLASELGAGGAPPVEAIFHSGGTLQV